MHDYIRGVFESLSWVKELLQRTNDPEKIKREVESALEDIEEGVAIDFRRRLRPIRV